MRIIPMVAGLLCTFLTIHAQKLSFSNNLRPAELVETARNAQTKFKQYEQLLQSRPATAVPDDIATTPARIYELLDESRGDLLGEAPLAWELPLEDPEGRPLLLDLVRVDPFTDDFRITTASGQEVLRVDRPLLYRGVVRGSEESSVVALTLGSRGLTGMINYEGGDNLMLQPLEPVASRPGRIPHVLSVDTEDGSGFSCDTPDSGVAYTAEAVRTPVGGARSTGCVRVYFEVDYDIYQDKGSVNAAVDFVTDLWSQVATLYANDGISVAVSEIKVWDTPSPYGGNSSSTMLSQFQNVRTSFNGDLGQLLSYQASGGIAVLSGLCHPYTAARLSFSSISGGFNTVPNYSWSVMVVAHELGHLLGSQHTHACVWNGNGTAIDGCAGFTEGSCANPGAPAGGGTLMSYCHVTSVGIDFTKGFGTQPRNVILNKINSSTCLQTCATGGGGGGTGGGTGGDGSSGDGSTGCDQEEVYIEINLDNYGMETKWRVLDGSNVVVAKGGPYLKEESGQTMRDTLCLPEGCYTFRIEDEHEDGLCCNYGEGSYAVRDAQGQVLASGAEFAAAEATDFCLPYDPNDNPEGECAGIDFSTAPILSYGETQDAGQYQLLNSGQTLYILNNAWKAVAMDYTITPNTVLEFEFRSTKQGEIHGIGFDDDNYISSGLTFRVYGSQYWGIGDFANYPGNGNWKSYSIPVGEYYTGTANKLFFVADQDGGTRDGNAYFRNVRIHEGNGCANLTPPTENTENPATVPADDLRIYPNPTQGTAWLEVRETTDGTGHWTIRDLTGRVVRQGKTDLRTGNNRLQLDVSGLPDGSYVLQWSASDRERQTRFTVVH